MMSVRMQLTCYRFFFLQAQLQVGLLAADPDLIQVVLFFIVSVHVICHVGHINWQ